MKNKLGIHYPNGHLCKPADNCMGKFFSIDWQSMTVLHLQRDKIAGLRWQYPNARILIRAYLENWYHPDHATMLENGRQWARECAQWMREQQPYTYQLTWANEQNLRDAGHPDGAGWGNSDLPPAKYYDGNGNVVDANSPNIVRVSCQLYEDIRDWNIAVIEVLRKEIPWAVLHFPALSQGHSDDQDDGTGYVGFEILRPAVEMCDVLDVHTYWESEISWASWDSPWYGRRYEKPHALFRNKPIFISEYAPHLPSQPSAAGQIELWLNNLPDYIIGTALFIWDSDVVNKDWIVQDQLAMVGALQSYAPSQPQPGPEPQPMPIPSYVKKLGKNSEGNEWPNFFVQWCMTDKEYYHLIDWGHQDNTGWSGLLVIVFDEHDKPLPGITVYHPYPQPQENGHFDGVESAVTEMKDLDGKNVKIASAQNWATAIKNRAREYAAQGTAEVAAVQFIVDPAKSGIDDNGMGPHNAHILPLSDVFYGSGTRGNRHYQDLLVFKRVPAGSAPPPPPPPPPPPAPDIVIALEALTDVEGALETARDSIEEARAALLRVK